MKALWEHTQSAPRRWAGNHSGSKRALEKKCDRAMENVSNDIQRKSNARSTPNVAANPTLQRGVALLTQPRARVLASIAPDQLVAAGTIEAMMAVHSAQPGRGERQHGGILQAAVVWRRGHRLGAASLAEELVIQHGGGDKVVASTRRVVDDGADAMPVAHPAEEHIRVAMLEGRTACVEEDAVERHALALKVMVRGEG